MYYAKNEHFLVVEPIEEQIVWDPAIEKRLTFSRADDRKVHKEPAAGSLTASDTAPETALSQRRDNFSPD